MAILKQSLKIKQLSDQSRIFFPWSKDFFSFLVDFVFNIDFDIEILQAGMKRKYIGLTEVRALPFGVVGRW